jgi:hypothetical protein
MKVEWHTLLGASGLLGIMGVVYWILVATHGHPSEYAGVTLLLFSFAAYALMGAFILLQWRRRRGTPRPEDRFDATQEDGAGEVAYFPSASIWPAGMGLGAVICAAAFVWGVWYIVIGLPIFLGAVTGWVFESEHTAYDPELPPKVFDDRRNGD